MFEPPTSSFLCRPVTSPTKSVIFWPRSRYSTRGCVFCLGLDEDWLGRYSTRGCVFCLGLNGNLYFLMRIGLVGIAQEGESLDWSECIILGDASIIEGSSPAAIRCFVTVQHMQLSRGGNTTAPRRVFYRSHFRPGGPAQFYKQFCGNRANTIPERAGSTTSGFTPLQQSHMGTEPLRGEEGVHTECFASSQHRV